LEMRVLLWAPDFGQYNVSVKLYLTWDGLINNGWLTLVSPKYADLGHNVMNVIVGVATPVSIREMETNGPR
jgi:hypothetical protein